MSNSTLKLDLLYNLEDLNIGDLLYSRKNIVTCKEDGMFICIATGDVVTILESRTAGYSDMHSDLRFILKCLFKNEIVYIAGNRLFKDQFDIIK